MKNKTIHLILACMALSGWGYSEKKERLADQSFVVETSDSDVDGALNRLAGYGKADRGYATEEYTYQSENHGKAGPFGRQQQMDSKQ